MIKQLELIIQRYSAAILSAELDELPPAQVDTYVRYQLEQLAHLLQMTMQVPAQVLQQERVIATYPTSWWDAVKARMHLKHKRTAVQLTEHLLYPHVAIPPGSAGKVRLYVHASVTPFFGEEA